MQLPSSQSVTASLIQNLSIHWGLLQVDDYCTYIKSNTVQSIRKVNNFIFGRKWLWQIVIDNDGGMMVMMMIMVWLWYDYDYDYDDNYGNDDDGKMMVWFWYDYGMIMVWLWHDYYMNMALLWYEYDDNYDYDDSTEGSAI